MVQENEHDNNNEEEEVEVEVEGGGGATTPLNKDLQGLHGYEHGTLPDNLGCGLTHTGDIGRHHALHDTHTLLQWGWAGWVGREVVGGAK